MMVAVRNYLAPMIVGTGYGTMKKANLGSSGKKDRKTAPSNGCETARRVVDIQELATYYIRGYS